MGVDYYPGGLTFNSYSTSPKNNYLYNQGTGDKTFKTERQPELQVDFTKYRVYDPALLRFWQVDPKADQAEQESWTPYHYSFNNPILYNDPYGDCPKCWENFKAGVSRIVNMYNDGGQRLAHDQRNKPAPSVQRVTGNRIVDAGIKLAGGDTFRAAANGDVKAQGRVIMGAITSLGGAKGGGKSVTSKTTKASSQTGKIYKVPGNATSSGKPYVGRTKQASPAARGRGANDGRDRTQAEVIDGYDPSQKGQGAYKEQKAIDANGGVSNLDNKRNEVSPTRMEDLEKKYGDQE